MEVTLYDYCGGYLVLKVLSTFLTLSFLRSHRLIYFRIWLNNFLSHTMLQTLMQSEPCGYLSVSILNTLRTPKLLSLIQVAKLTQEKPNDLVFKCIKLFMWTPA